MTGGSIYDALLIFFKGTMFFDLTYCKNCFGISFNVSSANLLGLFLNLLNGTNWTTSRVVVVALKKKIIILKVKKKGKNKKKKRRKNKKKNTIIISIQFIH